MKILEGKQLEQNSYISPVTAARRKSVETKKGVFLDELPGKTRLHRKYMGWQARSIKAKFSHQHSYLKPSRKMLRTSFQGMHVKNTNI